ncbi:MAG TPA: ATP-binding protein [Gemmataceae bacterium]|jgi:heavy metal sensor kinase
MFVQTVRFRLTLWSTAVVFLLLLFNIVAIRHGLEATHLQMVDEFIEEELHAAVLDLEHLGDRPDRLHEQFNRQATGHPRRRLFIQLIDRQGALVWSSEQSPSADVLPAGVLPEQEPETVADHRVLTQTLLRPGRPELTVRVGCSLERAHQELARFTSTLLAVGIVLLLIAPVGGYLLAGRATRPIARIISTTARLDPSHLDERLPLRGTHDELDRLSQTINRFLDRIAAYLRQSREFTANAAHELRSPLTALQSSLEITLNTDRSIEEYKEVLAVLLEECGQMRVLVNQLLLLAEEDAGRLQLHSQALRLDQIVANSLEMFQVVAESAGVELSVRRLEPAMLRGDGNRLWQVVNNLLDNAIKFTPAGGRIALDLRLDDARRQGVLEVSDTGTGIDPHDLPHIFDRFYQGDKARQRETISRGLGLGLSICQAVIAAHGGTIEVASAPGRGTTFTIRLPDCTRPGPSDPHAVPSSAWQSSDGKPVAESA